jgi:hypothetical protein
MNFHGSYGKNGLVSFMEYNISAFTNICFPCYSYAPST